MLIACEMCKCSTNQCQYILDELSGGDKHQIQQLLLNVILIAAIFFG